MDTNDIHNLFEYNAWATSRIQEAALTVTTEQFTSPERTVYGRSLRSILAHAYDAERIWRQRCQGYSPIAVIDETEFSTAQSLVEQWRAEQEALHAWLDSLRDEDLYRTIAYRNTKGKPFENKLWQILVHLGNHGTQTRAEAAMLLTDYGASPGDLDMILFLRERSEK